MIVCGNIFEASLLTAFVDNSPHLRATITISGAHINDRVTQYIDIATEDTCLCLVSRTLL